MLSAINNAFGVHSEDVQDIAVSLGLWYLHRFPVVVFCLTAAVQLKTWASCGSLVLGFLGPWVLGSLGPHPWAEFL